MTTIDDPHRTGARATRYATLCLLALLAVLCHSHEARAQWTTPDASGNINSTNTGNVGVGTSTPAYSLTVAKDQTTPTAVAVFNRADGTSAQASVGVSRTLDWSSKYLSFGVTAPSFSGTGFGDTAYIHSAGLPMKFGSETANDLLFFTNGINNARMAITGGGNVGVGTKNPLSQFHLHGSSPVLRVSGTATDQHLLIAFYDNNNDAKGLVGYLGANGTGARYTGIINTGGDYEGLGTTNFTPIYFFLNGAATHTMSANGNVGIGTITPAAKLDVAGDIRVSGNINAKWQDVAEWVPSTQKLAPGTVVVLDTRNSNHVLASKTSYDTGVAGVISAQPGLTLGEAGEGKALVATTGRVKVRVDASRAPIQIGDLLVTSDVEGVAMKSEPINIGGRQMHSPGTIIGKALEPLAKGTSEILVLLSLQ